ncbi:MAG: ABC transporter ATP-binding protein [Chloroflexota bacterium]|nr:ABC transporter ATP-binding protein [Chloroflexota bacterium]
MLKVENVSASYGELIVLHDVSLEVKEGEFISLVGANGAGKTSLMKVISGLLKLRAGKITLDGIDLSALAPHEVVKLGIIQVPEGRQLFSRMRVEENILLGGEIYHTPSELNASFERVYRLFPILEERKKQIAGTLSGGEQQMLAIARGLMANPRILLLDEPSIGLAPLLLADVFKVLQRLNREGVTILLAEQNVRYSLMVSSRGYVLERGHIILSGESKQLLNNEMINEAFIGR